MKKDDYIKQLESAIRLANEVVQSGEGVNIWYWVDVECFSEKDQKAIELIKKLCED